MRKILTLLALLFLGPTAYGAQRYRTVHNPFTGTQDYVVDIASTSVGALVDVSTVGASNGNCFVFNGTKWIPGACGGITAGSTFYIQNTNALQTGSTFYVSSGTVKGQFTTVASNANVDPLIVRGASLQSANIQEWQKSDGTVLASINSDGSFHEPEVSLNTGIQLGTQGVIVPSWIPGTPWIGMNTIRITADGSSQLFIGDYLSSDGGTLKAGSLATNAFKTFSNGAVILNTTEVLSNTKAVAAFNAAASASQALAVGTPSNSITNLVVLAAPAQSANLQEWQDNSGNLKSTVDKNGIFFAYPRTKAQLLTEVPSAGGGFYYCSDCTVDGVVQSTGSVAGSFAKISNRTTPIQ